MKRLFALLLTALCLLWGFAAHGDIAYAPPETDFYTAHQDECQRVERYFYTNGADGYISLREQPHGTIIAYITNSERVKVFCTYNDWAMVTHYNGGEQDTPGWVNLSELYLIYDEQSFREEHADALTNFTGELVLPEGKDEIYIYDYPGAKEPWSFAPGEDHGIKFSRQYTDPEGRIWGRISYYQGIRSQWVCISDPCSLIESFGGDPNLAQFEQLSKEKDIPIDEMVAIDAEEPPAKLPMDPILPIAIGLVVFAVAGAIVLIIVCYKRKER